MTLTTRKLMANIALQGYAMVISATEQNAAKELASTGLFKLHAHTVGGVACFMLKLTTE